MTQKILNGLLAVLLMTYQCFPGYANVPVELTENQNPQPVISLDETSPQSEISSELPAETMMDFLSDSSPLSKVSETSEINTASELNTNAVTPDGTTVLPGKPTLGVFNGGGAPTPTLEQSSASQFKVTYNVSNGGSFAGNGIFFSSPADLSGETSVIFQLRTDNTTANSCSGYSNCLKVEFVDSSNRVAVITVAQLTSSFKTYAIGTATIRQANSNINLSAIKQINFVIDKNMAKNKPSGFYEVKSGGLYFEPTAPESADAVTDFTNEKVAAGELEPCATLNQSPCTSGTLNTITNLEVLSRDQVQIDFNLGNGSDGANDFRRYGGALLTFETPVDTNAKDIAIQLKGTGQTGGQLKIEVLDDDGTKVVVHVKNLTSNYKTYTITKALLDSAEVSGFDASKVKNLVVVVDDGTTGSKTAVGTVQVKITGLDYVGDVNGTPFDPSALTNLKKQSFVSGNAGSSNGISDIDGTISIDQTSPRDFSFDYTLADDDDFVFAQMAYGFFDSNGDFFGTPQDLFYPDYSNPAIVLGLNGPAGKQVLIEVIDKNGKIAKFNANLDGSLKNYSLALSGDNIPDGFNVTKIAIINIVADKSKSGTSGTVTVRTEGLAFTPTINGTAFNEAQLTPIKGKPEVASINGSTAGDAEADGDIKIDQTSPRDFSIDYTLADGDDFVVAQITYGFFDTNGVFQGTPQDLFYPDYSNPAIVLGLNGTAGNRLTVEVVDKNGKVAKFYVNLDGSLKNYSLALNGDSIPDGFNVTKIAMINIVADNGGFSSDVVTVKTTNLAYVPTVNGATYNEAALTPIKGKPEVASLNGSTAGAAEADGTITVNQTSPRDFSFDYTLADNDDFVIAQMTYGFFDTNGAFQGTPQDLFYPDYSNPTIVLGLNGPAGKQAVIEVVDKNGKVAKFNVNLDGSLKNYSLALSGDNIPSGFNITKIAVINIVANKEKSGDAGTVTVKTTNLAYVPTVNGTTFNEAALTPIKGKPEVASLNGSTEGEAEADGTITVNQTSPRDFSIDYTLADDDDFVVAQMTYGYFDTNGAFQGTPQDLFYPDYSNPTLVLGLNGPAGKQVVIEVVDKNGKVAKFNVNLDGSLKNYSLALSGDNIPSGFNVTKIAMINIVANKEKSGTGGTVTVKTTNLAYVPTVNGAAFNQNTLTSFLGDPEVASLNSSTNGEASANGSISIAQVSSEEFNVDYTLADDDDFVIAQMTYGYFDTNGAFQGTPQDLFYPDYINPTLVLGLNGPAGKQAVVEVVDKNGKVAKFNVNLDGSLKNYSLALSGDNIPSGFNITKIAVVNIVMNKEKSGATGSLNVRTKGLDFVPINNGVPFNAADLDDFAGAEVAKLSGSTEGAVQANGTITVTQTSSGDFTADYTLADDDDFVIAQITHGYFDINGDFQGTPQDLFYPDYSNPILTLALNGAASTSAIVEIVDHNGTTVRYEVKLHGSLLNYAFDLGASNVPSGFNITKIALINIVMTKAKSGAAGTLTVKTKGLDYTPVVNGTAFDQSATTNFKDTAEVAEISGSTAGDSEADGTIDTTQTSAQAYSFDYTLADNDDFVISQIAYGYFDDNGDFVGTAQDLFNPDYSDPKIVLGLNGPAGKQVVVEVIDHNGNVADFAVNLDGTLKNYALALSGDNIPSGFNITKIAIINLVVDKTKAGAAGTIEVRANALKYSPVVSETLFNASEVSSLSAPSVSVLGSNSEDGQPAGAPEFFF